MSSCKKEVLTPFELNNEFGISLNRQKFLRSKELENTRIGIPFVPITISEEEFKNLRQELLGCEEEAKNGYRIVYLRQSIINYLCLFERNHANAVSRDLAIFNVPVMNENLIV